MTCYSDVRHFCLVQEAPQRWEVKLGGLEKALFCRTCKEKVDRNLHSLGKAKEGAANTSPPLAVCLLILIESIVQTQSSIV